MLGWILMILVVVWALKELAEGFGVTDRIKYGKQTRSETKRSEEE